MRVPAPEQAISSAAALSKQSNSSRGLPVTRCRGWWIASVALPLPIPVPVPFPASILATIPVPIPVPVPVSLSVSA